MISKSHSILLNSSRHLLCVSKLPIYISSVTYQSIFSPTCPSFSSSGIRLYTYNSSATYLFSIHHECNTKQDIEIYQYFITFSTTSLIWMYSNLVNHLSVDDHLGCLLLQNMLPWTPLCIYSFCIALREYICREIDGHRVWQRSDCYFQMAVK